MYLAGSWCDTVPWVHPVIQTLRCLGRQSDHSCPPSVQTYTDTYTAFTTILELNLGYNNNNNNNNRICILQVCRMTSEALDGQLQSCYTARAQGLNVWRKRNVFRLHLNRARELQHKVSVFREFQTAGAEHRTRGRWSDGEVSPLPPWFPISCQPYSKDSMGATTRGDQSPNFLTPGITNKWVGDPNFRIIVHNITTVLTVIFKVDSHE